MVLALTDLGRSKGLQFRPISNIRAFHSTIPLRIFDATLLSGLADMSLLDLTNLCYEHMVSLKIYGSELLLRSTQYWLSWSELT